MSTYKEKYRDFCKSEKSIPLFSQDWWLDTTVGKDNWDVLLIEKGGEITATFPYVRSKRLIFNLLNMPKLSPYLGIWMKYPPDQKYTTRLSYEKEITNELLGQLPNCNHFSQRFHPSFTNWLPFYWHSYEQTTKYTYILDDLSNLDEVFDNFRDNIKRNIRKAEKIVTISEDDDIEAFYRINQMTYERQNLKIPRPLSYVKKIDTTCKERNCRKILFAKDGEEHIHAAIYMVWDSNCCYYMMGGSNPEFKNSDATSLLFWEAIRFSSSQNLSFDFEGSMIEPIEGYIRGFGAIQTPFFQITKTSSRLLLLRQFLLKFMNPEKLVQ